MSFTKCAFIFLLTVSTACSDRSKPPTVGQSVRLFAFVEVNVVPMDSERVLKSQTVITQNDRIISVGLSDAVHVPANAKRIDGRGKYLMPGLADMHVHSWGEDLILFIANGVTTIRIMRGSSYHLGLREKIAQGELLGPWIYTSGPFIDGSPPDSADYPIVVDPEEATDVVERQKAAGYDFIKILSQLSQEVYEAIKAGTTNAAEFLGAAGEFGKVAVGQRADLILLHGNPLEDVSNTTRRAGVMLRGRWFSDIELKNMLENIVASYEKKTSK